MSSLICWLDELERDDTALVGGKGANLGRLLRLQLPVPPGFVVTTEAYRAFLAASNLPVVVEHESAEDLRARILATPIPPALSVPILDAYEWLGVSAVAVRSSGTAEDLATASFAGQHDTFLNVAGPEALLEAVRGCWASLWSSRAVAYRRRQGLDEGAIAMAVVVQAMVPAEWAGVLFTADPVSGERERIVIEAVAGLGEALVSGERGGERHVLEKTTLRLLAGGSGLPHQAIQVCARLGLAIETAFGQPQDIEWAYAGGRCYVLQARPLTALPSAPAVHGAAPSGPRRRYTRFQRANAPNMVDHIPVPPHPFDQSLFFRPGMARILRALRGLGFAPPALEEVFVEIGDGVVQVVPPAFRPTFRAVALPGRLLAALRTTPDTWLAECRATLGAPARAIDEEELTALSEQELLDRIELLARRQVGLFVRRFGSFPRGMLLEHTLSLLLRLAVGATAPRMQTDLLADIPCITTDVNRALGRLAGRIRASDDLRGTFLQQPPERIATTLSESPDGRDLLAELQVFLQRYGSRETAMAAAALPAWRDAPSVVYGLLKGLVAGRAEHAEGRPSRRADDGASRAEKARHAVLAALSGRWFGLGRRLLAPLFSRTLTATRAFVAFREDSHFCLFGVFPVVRRLALELGCRLVQRGVLDQPDDIFFLEIEEIRRLDPVDAVQERVRHRRLARQAVEGRYTTVPAELLAQATGSSEVRGIPVSPGQATGSVRVILREQDFWTLQRGEVLVAHYTNPTWTPLFSLAGAVVVDAGGVASHAAIVAREYGVPAVMGARDATTRLRDGQRVLVDGDRGRVLPLGDSRAGR